MSTTSSSQRSSRLAQSLPQNTVPNMNPSNSPPILLDHYRQIFKNRDIITREWFFSKIDKILDINSPTSVSVSSNVNPTIKNVTVVFGGPATGKTFLFQMLLTRKPIQNRVLLSFFCQSPASPAFESPDNPSSLVDFTSALAQ